MAIHIIVDGYNLIKQSPVLSRLDSVDLEGGRNELISRLAAYKKMKRHEITVVFDGCKGGGIWQERSKEKGIKIIFSRRGEEADDIIKRVVEKKREKMVVVTSDREIVDFSERKGAAVIPSPEFEMKMEMAAFSEAKGIDEEYDDESPERTLHIKKKGPSRRLKKSKRRSGIKINKL